MISSSTIDNLPEWAHDLSWVEDAYQTAEGRQRIKQITDAVFLSEIEHPELLKKGFEMIRRGIESDSPLAKDLLFFWRSCGFGVTDEKIMIENQTPTQCFINCELDKFIYFRSNPIAFQMILEIARLDTLINDFRIRFLPKLGKLEHLLFTNSNLIKLSIDTSRLRVNDICKLFLATAENNSLQELLLWSARDSSWSLRVYESAQKELVCVDTEELVRIETSVSTMLEKNQSLNSLSLDYKTFDTNSKIQAFFKGLCSISKNKSIQKLHIWPQRPLKEDLVPVDDFLKSLSFNVTLLEIELGLKLTTSQIIFFLNNLKWNRSYHMIKSLSITPELSNPEAEPNLEVLLLFHELAKVRIISTLIFCSMAMPESFQQEEEKHFLELASNNPFFEKLFCEYWKSRRYFNPEIEKKLKESKSRHPTLIHTLIGWV